VKLLKQFKKDMNADPKQFIVPYEAAMFSAVKDVFEETEIIPSYIGFVKILWKELYRLKLKNQ
jgi:hypothetical protein